MKYIQIGERIKGRFKKSEQMSLQDFGKFVNNECFVEFDEQEFNLFQKLKGDKKRYDREVRIYKEAQEDLISIIMYKFAMIIDLDRKSKRVI